MSPELSHLKVAVTGANGFIGGAVVKKLVSAGSAVRVLHGPDRESTAAHSKICEVVTADICDVRSLSNLLDETEVVVHLAGPPSVAASFEMPAESVRVHTMGTASLLDVCVRRRVRRFVYVSSAEVYGRPDTDFVSEEHRLEARSPYAAAKIGAEKLVEAYKLSHGMETVILRPFSIYGPGASPRSVVGTIVDLVGKGAPIVLNDLRPVRDYCHVEDAARAIVAACVQPVAGMTLNIGTMLPTSVLELAQAAIRLIGGSSSITSAELPRPANSDIFRLVADNRRAHKALLWQPEIFLEEGLRSLLEQSSE